MPSRIPNARPKSVASHASTRDEQRRLENKIVFGMGSCGLDYLASIAKWPGPDDKLRTESLETQGGGNCANALTAAARLGVPVSLISKIGDDGIGDQIVDELIEDKVSTEYLIRADNSPSPFTYIIVDRSGGTRCCIHTPAEPLSPDELQPQHEDILSKASLVYFDGRLTEAAIPLARKAQEAGVPILVEAERLRPHLQELLPFADYISTSAKFPSAFTGEEVLGDAILEMLLRLPKAKWSFTTLGAKGAVLVQRSTNSEGLSKEQISLTEVISQLQRQQSQDSSERKAQTLACKSADGTEIWDGSVVESSLQSLTKSGQSDGKAIERAQAAARDEAARNAGSSRASEYAAHPEADSPQSGKDPGNEAQAGLAGRVFLASAAVIPQEAIKDTTGAGDASVGSLLYGLSTGMHLADIMKLAAVVSARKCTDFGARSGLPWRSQLRENLLETHHAE